MPTYRASVTITDPKQVVLTDLPFAAGEQVEVTVRSREDRNALSERLQRLFHKTQQEAAHLNLTDEDIAAEIEAARAGR
jgi:hypothetical protein